MKRILGLLAMGTTMLLVFSGCGRMTEGETVKETYTVISDQTEVAEVTPVELANPPAPWIETTTEVVLPNPPAPWWPTTTTEEVLVPPPYEVLFQKNETELTAPPAPWLNTTAETELPNPPAPCATTEETYTNPPAPWLTTTTELKTTEAEEELTAPPMPGFTATVETAITNPPMPGLTEETEITMTNPPAPGLTTTTETKIETVPVETDMTNPPAPVVPTESFVPDVRPTADFSAITNAIQEQKSIYPGMHIGVGLYALDGTQLFGYNVNETMAAGCTVKAYYAKFVLEQCEEYGIDIYETKLTYKSYHLNRGSGVIKDNFEPGAELTINYLLKVLLAESDNTAYNILLDRFGLYSYQRALDNIGGQNLGGMKYGNVSVAQRKNEWIDIWQYVNSDAEYADTLKAFLSNTKYCYLVQGMNNWHTYLHKSGWIEGTYYTCAADCAIVDDQYLLIVLTYDAQDDVSNASAVKRIGRAVEVAVNNNSGIF